MGGPLVSVIMPIFQQEPYVAEALRSVMGQAYEPLDTMVAEGRRCRWEPTA